MKDELFLLWLDYLQSFFKLSLAIKNSLFISLSMDSSVIEELILDTSNKKFALSYLYFFPFLSLLFLYWGYPYYFGDATGVVI